MRRNSDDTIRDLARRIYVKNEHDLIPQLMLAWQRANGQAAADVPQAMRAVEFARGALMDLAEGGVDDTTWNETGLGYRAVQILETALEALRGRVVDVDARLDELSRDPEPDLERGICSLCGRLMQPEELGDVFPGEIVCDQCAGIAVCSCGHAQGVHHEGRGFCRGRGYTLEPEYGVHPDEHCACREFRVE